MKAAGKNQLTTSLRRYDPEKLEDALPVLDDVVLEHGGRELGLRAGRPGGRGGAADEAVRAATGGDPLELRQGLAELKANIEGLATRRTEKSSSEFGENRAPHCDVQHFWVGSGTFCGLFLELQA